MVFVLTDTLQYCRVHAQSFDDLSSHVSGTPSGELSLRQKSFEIDGQAPDAMETFSSSKTSVGKFEQFYMESMCKLWGFLVLHET